MEQILFILGVYVVLAGFAHITFVNDSWYEEYMALFWPMELIKYLIMVGFRFFRYIAKNFFKMLWKSLTRWEY